jgi:hypothetical protein
MTCGGDGWENHILEKDHWFWVYFGVKEKKGACVHTSSLGKGDNPQCFSFHPLRIKPTIVELTLMQ